MKIVPKTYSSNQLKSQARYIATKEVTYPPSQVKEINVFCDLTLSNCSNSELMTTLLNMYHNWTPITRSGLVPNRVGFKEQFFSGRKTLRGEIIFILFMCIKWYIGWHHHINNGILLEPQNFIYLVGFDQTIINQFFFIGGGKLYYLNSKDHKPTILFLGIKSYGK